jgi:hypothetical protein
MSRERKDGIELQVKVAMATSSVLSDNGGIVRLPLISLPTGSDYHIGFVESLVAQQSLNCMH